jgi:hypothetical protein
VTSYETRQIQPHFYQILKILTLAGSLQNKNKQINFDNLYCNKNPYHRPQTQKLIE